jgi:hypothetical protein
MASDSWGWDSVQETLFGLGGLAVSYEQAKNPQQAQTAAQDAVSDLPPTPQQQMQSNTSAFMGIDFSKPTNIIGAIILVIATTFFIKKI